MTPRDPSTPTPKGDDPLGLRGSFAPHFIGIGAARSGTTWVARMLEAHPGICLSEPKEVNYFNGESPIHENARPGGGTNPNRKQSLEWYAYHFKHRGEGQILGEFSTSYFTDEDAPRNVRVACPLVKLLAVLRDPVARLYSDYWMFRQALKWERRPFERAVREEPQYVERSLYGKHLRRWLRFFPREQLHVVLLDDIKTNPEGTLHDVLLHVGADPGFVPPGIRHRVNEARQARFRSAPKVMEEAVRGMVGLGLGPVVRALKRVGVNRALIRLTSKEAAYPPMDAATRRRLKGLFREDVEDLERLLDRDLSAWK